MLSQVVRGLGELTIQTARINFVGSLQAASGIRTLTGSSAAFGGTTGFLLPAATNTLSKRTYFSAMSEDGRGETAANGYGITLYDSKKGERTALKAVEMRFKRLDWGMWIRTRAGRNKKAWKKSRMALVNREKHLFCAPYHNRRFDLCVHANIKQVRHIPDDPYKVYNDMSFQNYRSIRLKNSELVKKHGSQIYNFPIYTAHYKKHTTFRERSIFGNYEPPGYHKDVADGDGVFIPTDRAQNEPPPNYVLELRHDSHAAKFEERRYWKKIRKYEAKFGALSQSHVLKLPQYGTKLG